MLLRQMKYFAAVVECGSFTEAAEQCYISQSAISQQIRTLEKELGVELLHRGNRDVYKRQPLMILRMEKAQLRSAGTWRRSAAFSICGILSGTIMI